MEKFLDKAIPILFFGGFLLLGLPVALMSIMVVWCAIFQVLISGI